MVASPDGGSGGDDLAAATSLRDRILAAFLADGSAVLVERDPGLASLRLTSGEQVVLITCPAGAPPSALRPAFDSAVQRAAAPVVHVVAVGGGPGVARELRRSAPFWQLQRRFGFHQVDARGRVERVTGQRLSRLSQAAEAAAGMQAPGNDHFAPYLAQGQQRHAEESQLDAALSNRFPWLTVTLGAVCVILFVLGQSWADGNFPLVLYHMGANSGAAVKAGEVWRLVASMFLHLNVEHIAFNMLALAAFGPVLERLLGPQRYLLLYGLSGLGGGIASALLSHAGFSVGASGAIWGLMAAGLGLALRPRGLLPPLRLQQARRRAILPLAINFLYSFQPGVDAWAHFGGGIVGFALMVTGVITLGVDPLWTEGAEGAELRRRRRSSGSLTLAALVFAILLVASLVLALVAGRPWQLSAPPVLERVRVADTGLAVEVPSVVSKSLHEETRDAVRVFNYGDLGDAPVVVEVIVNVLPHPVLAEQLDDFLESERQAMMQDATVPNAQRQGDARIVTVGARRFASATYVFKNRVTMRSWATALGDSEVVLQVLSLPDRPAAWTGIEDKIVASLQRQ
jgi:membrane associated rhomboid family serine protease